MTANFVWAIIGQVSIILGLLGTVMWALSESNRKPRTYWYIFRNRLRYIFLYIGFFRFMGAKLANLWYIILRKRNRITFEDHPYNYPWNWLRDNKLYFAIFVYVPTTLGIIFELCHQVSTGYVLKKPADIFFISPIRSVSLILMLVYLAETARYWKRQALNQMKKSGTIIDKTGKIDELSQ